MAAVGVQQRRAACADCAACRATRPARPWHVACSSPPTCACLALAALLPGLPEPGGLAAAPHAPLTPPLLRTHNTTTSAGAGSLLDAHLRRRAPAAAATVVVSWLLELFALVYATAVWSKHVSSHAPAQPRHVGAAPHQASAYSQPGAAHGATPRQAQGGARKSDRARLLRLATVAKPQAIAIRNPPHAHCPLPRAQFGYNPIDDLMGAKLITCRRDEGINDAIMATWLLASTWAIATILGVMVRPCSGSKRGALMCVCVGGGCPRSWAWRAERTTTTART